MPSSDDLLASLSHCLSKGFAFQGISDAICESTCCLSMCQLCRNISPLYMTQKLDGMLGTSNCCSDCAWQWLCSLSTSFQTFRNVRYHSHNAKQHILQMPLVAIWVGTPDSGLAEVYLFELIQGVKYQQFLQCSMLFILKNPQTSLPWVRSSLKVC